MPWANAEATQTREHMTKIKRTRCLGEVKKYWRVVDAWNSLEDDVLKIVKVKQFKERLDKCGYGDRTV